MIDSYDFNNTYQLNIFKDLIKASHNTVVYVIHRKFDQMKFNLYSSIYKTESEINEQTQQIKKIMKFAHKNIAVPINFFTEKAENGYTFNTIMNYHVDNLEDQIKRRKLNNETYTLDEILKMMRDIVPALVKLEECDAAHGNIKPSNILISNTGDYILSDMCKYNGYNNKIEELSLESTSFAYISPQLYEYYSDQLKNSSCSMVIENSNIPFNINKSDVFSLGLILLAMLSLKGIKNLNKPGENSENRRIDLITELKCPQKLQYILKEMLCENEAKRPNFHKVNELLKNLNVNNNNSMEKWFNKSADSKSSNNLIEEKSEVMKLSINFIDDFTQKKLELSTDTTLHELQEYLENLAEFKDYKFYYVDNFVRVNLLNNNDYVTCLGSNTNIPLELFHNNDSQLEFKFVSYKNKNKNKVYSIIRELFKEYPLIHIIEIMNINLEDYNKTYKFFKCKVNEDYDSINTLEYIAQETLIEDIGSDEKILFVEYNNEEVKNVKIKVLYYESNKILDIHAETTSVAAELISEIKSFLHIDKETKCFIEKDSKRLLNYAKLSNANIKENDTLVLKKASVI